MFNVHLMLLVLSSFLLPVQAEDIAVDLMPVAPLSDYTNSIGMEFKSISSGIFYMGSCQLSETNKEANRKRKLMGLAAKGAFCLSGSNGDDESNDDETPEHQVQITQGFQMGTYEVTLGQFKKFVSSAGRDDLLTNDFIEYNSHGDSAAVTFVSWNDAQAFIHWLNEKEGTAAYRLPTEAEWEYAARAGTNTIYSWGDSKELAASYAWYDKNAYDLGQQYAHTVGDKAANPWGLYDMHGNVWEWVQDLYDENYYSESEVSDPQGPSAGRDRVSRGGGWIYHEGYLRAAVRYYDWPGYRSLNLGLRLVRQP